jgi:anti-sigma factor ChrR (cupin superfamily)
MVLGKRQRRTSGFRRGRGVGGRRHDPYVRSAKPPGESHCPDCDAIYRRGRWQWGSPGEGARKRVCPACQRTREGQPAGILRLEGAPARQRAELCAFLRNVEAEESREHALERILRLRADAERIEVETTGTHLARRMAQALRRSWPGNLKIRYVPGQDLVRVEWQAKPGAKSRALRTTA